MIDYTKAADAGGIGAVIRSIRKNRRLSQAALAQLLGCTQNTVSRYETRRPSPSLHPLRKLLELAEDESQSRVILARLQDMGAIISHGPSVAPAAEGLQYPVLVLGTSMEKTL
jgi:transcriptional regulator with XRE-family HTH domain